MLAIVDNDFFDRLYERHGLDFHVENEAYRYSPEAMFLMLQEERRYAAIVKYNELKHGTSRVAGQGAIRASPAVWFHLPRKEG
jgi:hypothetical protein